MNGILPRADAPSSGSEVEEDDTIGPARQYSSGRSVAPQEALDSNQFLVTVVTNVVTSATNGNGCEISNAELLQCVADPNMKHLITSVNELDIILLRSFVSVEDRKLAVVPVLLSIRDAILALPEDLLKRKLQPQVARINEFAQ
jgi:hypothetical protein